ncbi:MAG: hypothetical protein HGA94_03265, partial [Candidatus Aminicenantes bacterium]|nr:hypothetical protein [Candidatus Aminicenantes bacterium]
MKRKHLTFLAILAACSLLAILGLAADKVIESLWQSGPMTIDGVAQEWETSEPIFDEGSQVQYALRNDGRNLYIIMVFRTPDRASRSRIYPKSTLDYTGMRIYFTTGDKKAKDFGILFQKKQYTADALIANMEKRGQVVSEAEKAEIRKKPTHIVFSEEIIKPKNFDHCGEPCAVVCKKYNGEFKKDYEPYEALGPQCGVFDQRAAERLNKFVDTMGLDSIQTGGTVAWIMELIADGLIPAADFGLPIEGPRFSAEHDAGIEASAGDPNSVKPAKASTPDTRFVSRAEQFNIVQDSAHNADYAIAVIKMVLFSEAGAPFRLGLRAAAKWLDEKYGIKSLDRAVFTAHGEAGCMVPNQYWTPGMFAPMPLMGKYF